MNGGVGGQFGVESGSQDVAVLHEDRFALMFRQDACSPADFFDDRAANENHFERFAGELAGFEEDVARELPAITVAKDGHVQKLERILGRVFDLGGQENGTGAGAEDGVAGGRKFADGAVEAFFLEELKLGGGFASGKDKAVAAVEIGDGADFDRRSAEFAEAGGVGGEVTLNSEDTDFHVVFRPQSIETFLAKIARAANFAAASLTMG